MTILLDTNVLIFALADRRRIGGEFLRDLLDSANDVYFSTICIWEIAIKFALRRPDFLLDPETVLVSARDAGFTERTFDSDTARRVASLPLHHRDPFDRLLVVQALTMPARLYTTDRGLLRYSELVSVVA